jgi:hypothetical protein
MAGNSNELSGKCHSFCRIVSEVILCDDREWWYHWECANTTGNNLNLSKPWYCVSCKQAILIREQVETILDLQRKLALAHGQIASLKADNSCSSKCNPSSAV